MSLPGKPKFSAFLVQVPGKGVTARDNNDKELPVAEGGGRMAVSGGGTTLNLRLNDVPRSARTVKLLEGSFNVIGAAKMLRFEYTKVGLEKQSQTIDGVKVTVNADFSGEELWRARVELEYPEGGPQMESFESGAWLTENTAFLLSTDNKRRMDYNGGSNVEAAGERRAVIEYLWVPPDTGSLGKAADWRLVVLTPSRLVEIPVKFKLENIPFMDLYLDKGDGTRYRSLGCAPCTAPIKSAAKSVDDIIEELRHTTVAERSGRAQDEGRGMELLRKDGYM